MARRVARRGLPRRWPPSSRVCVQAAPPAEAEVREVRGQVQYDCAQVARASVRCPQDQTARQRVAHKPHPEPLVHESKQRRGAQRHTPATVRAGRCQAKWDKPEDRLLEQRRDDQRGHDLESRATGNRVAFPAPDKSVEVVFYPSSPGLRRRSLCATGPSGSRADRIGGTHPAS